MCRLWSDGNLDGRCREKEGRDESTFFCKKDLRQVQVGEARQGFARDLRESQAQAAARVGSCQRILPAVSANVLGK